MYPHERSLVEKLQGQPFALVGVNSDGDKDDLKKAMEKEKITWRSWFDGSTKGPIASQWRLEGWPTLFLIDHKGVIRHKWVGGPPAEQLETFIGVLVRAANTDLAKKEKAKKIESAAAKTAAKATQAEEKPSEEKNDEQAFTKLKFAKQLLDDGKNDKARDRLQDIIKKYPKSTAADEAKELLKKLKK